MTQNNWGREYPAPNFGRDLNAGHDFGRELGGYNFGRDLGGSEFGAATAPPLAWYSTRLLATQPANILGYWRLSEPFGAVATDSSGNGRHGATTGADLGQPGIGDGLTAYGFDGAADFVNIHSAGFASAFNPLAGTAAAWCKMSGAGVWADGQFRRVLNIAVNTSNRVILTRQNTSNQFGLFYVAGGTGRSVLVDVTTLPGFDPLAWFHTAITWDKAADQVRCFINGLQVGATLTGLGTWVGTPVSTQMVIGANTTVPANVHSGLIAHVAVWNVALTAGEIAPLGRVA